MAPSPPPVEPPQPPSNRSPFSRSHIRSRSLAEVSGMPPMTRAHSSPGLDSRGRYIFVNGRGGVPANLDGTAKRYNPLHIASPGDHLEPRMMSLNISETISEQAELDIHPPTSHPEARSSSPGLSRIGRRRPSSPLQFSSTPAPNQAVGSPPSTHSSPMFLGSRYNESFPGYSTPSVSSMPSTPTSLRSRSPSISSLETIPDIPDAEDAAQEADRVAASKEEADQTDDGEGSNASARRRGTSDLLSTSNTVPNPRAGSAGYVRTDKRKRWSVCGAERRQDLDLETIWED